MSRKVNPTPLGMTLTLVVTAIVVVLGISEVFPPDSSVIDVPVGVFDRAVTPVPILVVDHDIENANLIRIDDDGLEDIRFFEVYRRRFADECGANVWSRWKLNAVVGKTIHDTYVYVDELVKRDTLYEYKVRAVDKNGNQVGAWSEVLSRRMPGEGASPCRQ